MSKPTTIPVFADEPRALGAKRAWLAWTTAAIFGLGSAFCMLPIYLFGVNLAAAMLVVMVKMATGLVQISGAPKMEDLLTGDVMFASFVPGFLGFVIAGGVTAWLIGWRIKHVYPMRYPGYGPLIAAVLGGFTVGMVPGWIAEQVINAYPHLENSGTIKAITDMLTNGGYLEISLAVLTITFGAAIFEELVFRGLLWTALERLLPGQWGQLLAWGVTSLAFAIIHGDPVQSTAVFLTGMFLGWLRWWSGSLWPCMVAHFINNALAIGMTWYLTSSGADDSSTVWYVVVAGGLFSLLLTLLAVVGRRRPMSLPGVLAMPEQQMQGEMAADTASS